MVRNVFQHSPVTAQEERVGLAFGSGKAEHFSASFIQDRLIAEEAISNIICHAYEGSDEHKIEVTLANDSSEIRLELRDNRKPFDPTEMPEPDLSLPIEEQTEGSLGIHLMKTLADEVSYVREGAYNILRLKKRY